MEKYKTEDGLDNQFKQEFFDADKEHLEVFIISALEKHAQKIDEGSKGVILKIDLSTFTDEELQDLGIKINRSNGSVFKILKIENSILARCEARSQERASEILNTDESRMENLAKVPSINKCEDIDVSNNEKVCNFLKRSGINIGSDNKINVIMMDYIPGVDLSFYIFRKILDKIIEKNDGSGFINKEILENYKEWLSVANFKDLYGVLEQYFGINFYTDDMRVVKENEKVLFDYMEKNEILLNKEIFEVFRKSVVKLNDNDFYHNDLHERNVRVVLGENDNLLEMYFIDFADATNYLNNNAQTDLAIYQVYEKYTTTKQEKSEKMKNHSLSSFEKYMDSFNKGDRLIVWKVDNIKYAFYNHKKLDTKEVLQLIKQELVCDEENIVAIAIILCLEENIISKKYIRSIIDLGMSSPGPTSKWRNVENILLTKNLL